jgi:N-acetylmuramoyl-L-alanine amidase
MLSELVGASMVSIEGMRIRPSPDKTRLVFDLGQPVDHKIFTLTDPHRLVIDIQSASLNAQTGDLSLKGTPIRSIRSSSRNEGKDIRVVTREVSS